MKTKMNYRQVDDTIKLLHNYDLISIIFIRQIREGLIQFRFYDKIHTYISQICKKIIILSVKLI